VTKEFRGRERIGDVGRKFWKARAILWIANNNWYRVWEHWFIGIKVGLQCIVYWIGVLKLLMWMLGIRNCKSKTIWQLWRKPKGERKLILTVGNNLFKSELMPFVFKDLQFKYWFIIPFYILNLFWFLWAIKLLFFFFSNLLIFDSIKTSRTTTIIL